MKFICVGASQKKEKENKFASGKDHENCVRRIFSTIPIAVKCDVFRHSYEKRLPGPN
jgi:hypothetical protein